MKLGHNNLGFGLVDAELPVSDLHISFLLRKKLQYLSRIIIRILETFTEVKVVEVNDLVDVPKSYQVSSFTTSINTIFFQKLY